MTASHLSLPLRVGDGGGLAAHAVGSPAEIGQSVGVLLSTRIGERRSEPAYGSTDGGLFGPQQAAQLDVGAVMRWEPRLSAAVVDVALTASAGTS
jgi:phage baseplate assembly protein W